MSNQIKVSIHDGFWDAFIALPKQQQKKTQQLITKFRQSPTSSGLNYERINGMLDSYRSLRVDQNYRCIVMAPSSGDVYLLLWVDKHDDAYTWASRKRIEVNATTGTLQIYSTLQGEVANDSSNNLTEQNNRRASDSSTPEHLTKTTREAQPDTSDVRLFNLDESRLLGIGVPVSRVELVVGLKTYPDLEAIKSSLPDEAWEALALFAEGLEWKDIWSDYGPNDDKPVDTNDVSAALERDSTKRRFHVVDSDAELQSILAAPLEKWRVYLHPSQRKLVDRDWNGPVRVIGGAGTGKTVVAMHRAVWLAKQLSDKESVLFLTYNTNLAADIANNLKGLATSDELNRIEVINIDAWVTRYLKARKYSATLKFESQLEDLWRDVLSRSEAPPGKVLPDSFYSEEWERIVLPNRIDRRDEYLTVSRAGRGVALNRRQRAAIWNVFDDMRAEMSHRGWKTYQDAMLDARDLIQEEPDKHGYRHVVVDETQDMGPEALQLIRGLVPESKNDLFFVGDGHQRIYRRRAVMGKCGIKIVGRARKLKINYRTTEQIKRFASAMLDGLTIDDLDGGEDGSKDYISLTRGLEPDFQPFDRESDEIDWVIQRLKLLESDEATLASSCVMLRTLGLRDKYYKAIREAGIDAVLLENRADNQKVPGVRVANMHRVKGLEFRHVILAAMCDGVVPNRYALRDSEDQTELREMELSERALVHVCASRAIETLAVTWHGKVSEYVG